MVSLILGINNLEFNNPWIQQTWIQCQRSSDSTILNSTILEFNNLEVNNTLTQLSKGQQICYEFLFYTYFFGLKNLSYFTIFSKTLHLSTAEKAGYRPLPQGRMASGNKEFLDNLDFTYFLGQHITFGELLFYISAMMLSMHKCFKKT